MVIRWWSSQASTYSARRRPEAPGGARRRPEAPGDFWGTIGGGSARRRPEAPGDFLGILKIAHTYVSGGSRRYHEIICFVIFIIFYLFIVVIFVHDVISFMT